MSLALLFFVALGCQGRVSDVSGDAARADGGGADGGGAPEAGAPDGGDARDGGGGLDGSRPPDAGEPPFDGGPCPGGGLASSLTVTSVGGVSARAPLFGAPMPGGGAAAAFVGGGAVTVQRLAGDGRSSGAPVTIAGDGLWGFDAAPDGYGAMVSRGSDALYFVGVSTDGAPRFSHLLLGEVPHDVTDNEWFGTGIRYGRLRFTGTQWAAYYTVNRLWSDGIAHYGDQLRLFAADGAAASTAWGWGCSHSMEVRVEHNGTILGPVCASDCYPSKGVHFNHRSARLYTDEGMSNCAGRYGTTLGGVVPTRDGFWVTFTATDARGSHDVAMVKVQNDRSAAAPIWLTEDGVADANVHAAAYGDGFVVAWTAGGTDRIVHLDLAGAVREGPVDVPSAGLAAASDFFVFEGGDVGWVTSSGGTLALARLRACE